MTPRIVALDHFAGSGWGVALHWLGILEYGVEKMHEAIRTRTRAGFRTIYRDVWSGLFHPWLVPVHGLYIASPPCQTFSVAGRGSGRKALDQVLALVASGAWKDPAKLLAAGADLGDPRTALVLTPLAHIWVHRPELVALEQQVPTVLPVWEAIAEVLRGLGYSVWTGNMQAEQYGVPQTRKRAILIARADGVPARPPVPTHSRYYSRTPDKLDPGVQKWVSMAEALGWASTDRVGFPRLTDGRGDVATIGGVEYRARDLRSADEPSFVVTEKARSWSRFGDDGSIERVTMEEAAALQSYPTAFLGAGGGADDRIRQRPRLVSEPAHTVTGARSAAFLEGAEWRQASPTELAKLQTFPEWAFERPATTIAGDSRVWAPGHKVNADDVRRLGDAAFEKYGDRKGTGAYRATVAEASILQTYPQPFPFQGTRGRQFLQIGNAVPPLMAEAIIQELVAPAAVASPAGEVVELSTESTLWDDVFSGLAA